MNASLSKKYKPCTLDEFHIDDQTKRIIELYLKNNKLYFIIQGNSCVGKTNIINVILKLYYKERNVQDYIIYINVLKEQGVNYYRNELKNFCQTNNIITNIKKTIIIDDIDYLNEYSQQLFHSFINNYENINFIITCNNLNKIDKSFLQKLEFIKINNTDHQFLSKILNKIVAHEKLDINEEFKNTIITSANNCIPNMINILEKICIIPATNLDDIRCNILISDMAKYITLCNEKQYLAAVNILDTMYNNGYSVIDILDELTTYIKLYSDLPDEYKYATIKILCKYINIFNNVHEDSIELLFLTNNIIG